MTAFKPILTRHLGQPGSSTIDYYLLNEGYRGARKAVLEMDGAGAAPGFQPVSSGVLSPRIPGSLCI